MTANSPLLCAQKLCKSYRERCVVDHVGFEVLPGEIVGLLGPNGAGKTTSFYMVAGLVRPDEGRVDFCGQDVTGLPMHLRARLGMGYLPQEESIFRKLSVEGNLMAILETRKDLNSRQQKEKCEELMERFSITRLRKSQALQLSGGEKRRLTIARALASNPKLIMLDEPFAGVDPIAVEDIQQIVWRLKYKNIGILITDHNVQETLSITDRAYLLFEGKILFQGTPEVLAANQVVREKYLSTSFVLRRKDFQLEPQETAHAGETE